MNKSIRKYPPKSNTCRPSGDISIVVWCRILVVPSLRKSLYSSNSVKSIGKSALIDDGEL
jgi:hypothetical protein